MASSSAVPSAQSSSVDKYLKGKVQAVVEILSIDGNTKIRAEIRVVPKAGYSWGQDVPLKFIGPRYRQLPKEVPELPPWSDTRSKGKGKAKAKADTNSKRKSKSNTSNRKNSTNTSKKQSKKTSKAKKEPEPKYFKILSLPNEIFAAILQQADYATVHQARKVCSQWRRTITNTPELSRKIFLSGPTPSEIENGGNGRVVLNPLLYNTGLLDMKYRGLQGEKIWLSGHESKRAPSFVGQLRITKVGVPVFCIKGGDCIPEYRIVTLPGACELMLGDFDQLMSVLGEEGAYLYHPRGFCFDTHVKEPRN